jgi:hypothetical protein
MKSSDEVLSHWLANQKTCTIYIVVKVLLKAKIVQILFSQIHKNYAEYSFQTFTVDGKTIADQIESMARIRMFCICMILVKTLAYFFFFKST